MQKVKKLSLKFIKGQKVLLATIVVFIISAILSPQFLSFVNLSNLMLQISVYGIISIGVMLVMLTGEFDISVGSLMAFYGILSIMISNSIGYWAALVALIPLSVIIGGINGLLVAKIKISSFVVTLGGMLFYRGLGYILCNSEPISSTNKAYAWIGTGTLFKVNYVVYVFLILVVVSWFIIRKTTFGRNICATGGNYEVAKASGVNVNFYKYAVYVICAFTALLSGMLAASRLSRAMPNAGEDASMQAISAVVIGGTSMSGGEGGAFQTLLGVFLLGLINNILNMMGVMAYYQQFIRGAILIIIVCLDRFYRNRAKN
jgi:ribose transport system permease protein